MDHNFFRSKIFSDQIFFEPKSCLTPNFIDQNLSEPNFFDPKFLLGQTFDFWPKLFLETNFFSPNLLLHNFLGPNIFWDPNLFWTQSSIGPKIFWIPHSFNHKCIGQKIYWTKTVWTPIFLTQKAVDPKFCGPQILFKQNIFEWKSYWTQLSSGQKFCWPNISGLKNLCSLKLVNWVVNSFILNFIWDTQGFHNNPEDFFAQKSILKKRYKQGGTELYQAQSSLS